MENNDRYPHLSREDLEEILYQIPFSFQVYAEDGSVLLMNENSLNTGKTSLSELPALHRSKQAERSQITIYPTDFEIDLESREEQIFYGESPNWRPTLFTSKNVFNADGSFRFQIMIGSHSTTISQYGLLNDAFQRTKVLNENALQYLNNARSADKDIIAKSMQMQRLLITAKTVAMSDSTISIRGESGTGKEVLARYIHQHSPRKDRIFLPVNCSAIPSELMEAEFFGYAKGAFTGANPKGSHGLFELANNGTLFLDEIGELPLSMQPKLLRVLETGQVRPIGSNKTIPVNVRIITATNRDLQEMVRQKQFREDLYYRLQVIPLELPPLRERREDILPLAEYFLALYNQKHHKHLTLTDKMVADMYSYPWPGNIREMRNIIERLVLTADLRNLATSAKTKNLAEAASRKAAENEYTSRGYHEAMDTFEKRYITEVMEESKGERCRSSGTHGHSPQPAV